MIMGTSHASRPRRGPAGSAVVSARDGSRLISSAKRECPDFRFSAAAVVGATILVECLPGTQLFQ